VAAGLFVVAALCVLAPGRPYAHYLHFLVMPLTVLLGTWLAAVIEPGQTARNLMLFAVCLLLPPIALRLSPREDPYLDYNLGFAAPDANHHALTARVKAFARPGDTLGLWGWRSSLYVETGLAQATCQAHTQPLLVAGRTQAYYLRHYSEKLAQAAPPVFVDAVGPGNFHFQNRALGHEIFPWLRQWVAEHYTYLGEWDGCRAYVRRDLLAKTPAS
jgi:hypothetical protein